MKSLIEALNEPAPYQQELMRSFHQKNTEAESVKRRAAVILGELPKPMRCIYWQNDGLAASFRYLDDADYKRFPMLRGVYNAVVVPAGKDKPYLHKIINMAALGIASAVR